MSVRIISLSYPVSAETPTYGNLPKPRIMSHTSMAAGGTSNTYAITLYNHTGTHVDAPAHFVPNGRRISDYSPEELVFRRPLLVDILRGLGRMKSCSEKDKIGRRIKRHELSERA